MPQLAPSLVVLDTETTDLDPRSGRLIDVAAVRLGPALDVADRFSTLVDPGVPIPLAVTRLTGLGDLDVRGAPSEGEALTALCAFARDALLIAHNASFDREHLAAAARRTGVPPLANSWFDTLAAALLLFPEEDSHALATLARCLGCDRQAHRALPDAETAAELFRRLCARAGGLDSQERRLLTLAGWTPLQVLDGRGVVPEGAPARVEEPPTGMATKPEVLPVSADGWRAELDAEDDGGSPGFADRLPGFRRRPGQVGFAAATASVFAEGGIGAFEAGTGSGKSLGYLLPAAFFGAATGRRVLVSTKTKALQRQLAARELPLVGQALPHGWRWAILMGRENYLCRKRLDDAAAMAGETLDAGDRALALAYLLGRARRGDVDLSSLPYRAVRELTSLTELARDVRSTRATCLGRHCPQRSACHWRLARNRAEGAHLVCVNHALLLTARETLPAFEDVVIDEAHLLPAEATEAFSERVDALALRRLLTDLRPSGQRPLARRLRSAARTAEPSAASLLETAARASERALEDLPDRLLAVGGSLEALARATAETDAGCALPAESDRAASAYDTSLWLTPGLQESTEWDAFATATSLLAEGLAGLASAAAAAADALPEEHRERPVVAAVAAEASALGELLDDIPRLLTSDSVAWGEIQAQLASSSVGRASPQPPAWSLVRAPLTPARQTRAALWDRLRGAVLTSATLTVGESFSYFRRMTGLDADLDVTERVFPSPFDYSRQAALVLERDPSEASRPLDLAERQGERLKALVDVTRGRTLVLFTNRRDMERVAAAVGAHVEGDDIMVLAQGLHGSAAALADEFRAHPATILLGVDTLWTGQDFPGDTLKCLVIAKLPFPRQDPLFRARCSACEAAGVRWFEEFYLPEAVLRFRQGFGRLIRSETDTGVVIVLDPRLLRQRYGRVFVESLPELPIVEAAPTELARVVDEQLRRLEAVDCPSDRPRSGPRARPAKNTSGPSANDFASGSPGARPDPA